MKILILAPNPGGDLHLDREIRDLKKVIENSPKSKEFEVVAELAVRVEDLQELLLTHQPQIVHFCGHGGEQGLLFESDSGTGHLVGTEALSDLFRLFSSSIKCVLLNACYSEKQAGEIINHIDYVIGMNQKIRDDAAIAFSKGFYLALGYAYSIEQSYEFGCNAIQLEISGSSGRTVSETERQLEVADVVENIVIPEHQKPILKKKETLTSSPNQIVSEEKRVEIQLEIDKSLATHTKKEEEIPDFLNNLLEDYFNKSSLKWSLCFTGEDESSKLGELIAELRNGFSRSGDGKQVPSGFSYWGIVSTLAWKHTSSDPLYPVMSDGPSSFNRRLNNIFDEEFTKQKYHYVSLGVGTGDKDNEILKRLYSSNNSLRYFPVDMSSTMLRLGVENATKGIPLKGSQVLPIQIDFSIKSNVIELRQLLDKVDNDDPILFSLLGNTLANFLDDTELLKTVSNLMRSGDKLLLGVATTQELSEEAAAAAAKEYATASSFKKFVTSVLLQYTDLRVDFANICFRGSIEQSNKSLLIKILYENCAKQTIPITLPDWESVEFKQGDTIRLLTTRKYSAEGLNKIILNSRLRKINSSTSLLPGHNQYGFGLDLILLMKEPG